MQYSYRKKIFSGRAKLIWIIGDPDKRSSAVPRLAVAVECNLSVFFLTPCVTSRRVSADLVQSSLSNYDHTNSTSRDKLLARRSTSLSTMPTETSILDPNPDRGTKFISSPKAPNWLWGPLCFQYDASQFVFALRGKAAGR